MHQDKLKIDLPKDRVADFWRHHICKLAFFGSVLRDDFGPDSDIDVLMEFQPGFVPGLKFFDMQRELSEILNLKVDSQHPGVFERVLPRPRARGSGGRMCLAMTASSSYGICSITRLRRLTCCATRAATISSKKLIRLDTNVLVRLLVLDDRQQTEAARRVVAEHCSPEDLGFVNLIVLCECVWVLKSSMAIRQARSQRR